MLNLVSKLKFFSRLIQNQYFIVVRNLKLIELYKMAFKGQIFENTKTGEVVEFIETSSETNGNYTRFKVCLRQGGGFKVKHFHANADEHFHVLKGTLSYYFEGKIHELKVGESITLKKMESHSHFNAHQEDLVMIQTISPSLDIDDFLHTLFEMAVNNKLDKNGQPPFLQVMLWINEMKSKTYLSTVPKFVQDTLASLLGPIAKRLGYRTFYKQ
jgi:mannose-6-phosphate isomerase-like protein (cupin superfamily)